MAEILAMKRGDAQGLLAVEQRGPILRIALANPPANPLSIAMMDALQVGTGSRTGRCRHSGDRACRSWQGFLRWP